MPYTDEDLRKGEAPKERFLRKIGSWAYDEESYDCHPGRDGELSNYLLITADRILLRVSLLFFISAVRREADVTRN